MHVVVEVLKGVWMNKSYLGPVFCTTYKLLLDEEHVPRGMYLMDLKEPPSLC